MSDAGKTGDEGTDAGTGEQDRKAADAGQGSGDKDVAALDAQKVYDRAFAEARRVFAPKIDELKAELDALKGAKKPDLDEVENVRAALKAQVEERDQRLTKAAGAWRDSELARALEAAGIENPNYHAKVLRDQVKAGLGETDFEITDILTDSGSKAINAKNGEPMTLKDFALDFAARNPGFVKASMRNGIGYGGARDAGGARKSLKDMSAKEKREFIAEHGLDKFVELLNANRVAA